MPLNRFLELLGLPTTNAQGHELGCSCPECMAARERREPFKPGTLGHVLQESARKATDSLGLTEKERDILRRRFPKT